MPSKRTSCANTVSRPSGSGKRRKVSLAVSSDVEDDALVSGSVTRGLFVDRITPSTSTSKSASVHEQGIAFYSVRGNEIIEDEDFIVVGEDPPLEADDKLPVRLFTEFTVYHKQSKQLVNIAELVANRDASSLRQYSASGFVSAWIEDDGDIDDDESDTESDETQYVQLSQIRHFNFLHYERKKLDSKMYFETEYGWYILEMPSKAYQAYFEDFWTKNKITHLLLSESLENRKLDKEEFLDMLDKRDEFSASVLKDRLEDDDVLAFALGYLLESSLKISRVPCIIQTLGELPEVEREDDDDYQQATKKKGDNETVVTRTVLQVCRRLFPQHQRFKLCDIAEEATAPVYPRLITETHSADPEIRWGNKSSVSKYYTSFVIDSTLYEVGDVVIVERGQDENDLREKNSRQEFSRSINSLANTKWFARISYMFEREGENYFHGQWLQHGSQTVVQEAAHPSVLFSMIECNDLHLKTIVSKCNMRTFETDNDLPLPDYDPRNENSFVCGLTWDETRSAFIDFSADQVDSALQHCLPHMRCLSCGMKAQRELFTSPRWADNKLHFLGLVYRKYDFVYVRNQHDDDVYTIGQLLIIGDNLTVAVRVYHRVEIKKPFDERRLHAPSKNEILTIPANQLEGICWAKRKSEFSDEHREYDWLVKDDHFVIIDPDFHLAPALTDRIGLNLHEKDLSSTKALIESNERLRGLELFAGAGGFGTGVDASGFVKTLWAVEWDESAAGTFQKNHRYTRVFNVSCNLFLTHAIQGLPLECIDGELSLMQPLPKRGEVDIIFGGPPCQAFSGSNHHKKPDDIRITLVCNMISYVEFYRPKFFMLENVENMLDFPLGAQLQERSLVGGIKKGVLKFILGSLTSLGYQVHFKLLQAGRYGVPQNRARVIFVASKRGCPLPEFPIPTHVFSRRPTKKNLANGQRLEPVSRIECSLDDDHICRCAPMPRVIFSDFLDDLPQFDWKNPRLIWRKRHDHSESERRAQGIAIFDTLDTSDTSVVGYMKRVPYPCPPKNMYQAMAREGKEHGTVSLHYTKLYKASVVERVVNIPIRPDADHTDLPKELRLVTNLVKSKSDGSQGQGKYRRIYLRMNGYTHVDTIMTHPNPTSKFRAIHPFQKRVLSVREYARLQGFPDSYKFVAAGRSPVIEQMKQIGNAVPVPLAQALGRAIGDVVLQGWRKEAEEADMSREGSPEV